MIQSETCICGSKIHVEIRNDDRDEEMRVLRMRIEEWRLNHKHEPRVENRKAE